MPFILEYYASKETFEPFDESKKLTVMYLIMNCKIIHNRCHKLDRLYDIFWIIKVCRGD